MWDIRRLICGRENSTQHSAFSTQHSATVTRGSWHLELSFLGAQEARVGQNGKCQGLSGDRYGLNAEC